MKESIPAIIVKNSAMVDKKGNPLEEASILPDAIMIHPDKIQKLLDGMKGAFALEDFTIMDTVEYKEYLNETYPDK